MITVVFAKVPGMGIAKSRIAAASDAATAERAYSEMLAATAGVVDTVHHAVAFTGAASPGRLEQVFCRAQVFFEQHGLDLGARMRHASDLMLGRGYAGVCLVGCDCPSMTAADIADAGRRLASGDDVVLGPAADGGYYLAACRRPGLVIYGARGWSTPGLLDETLAIVREQGVRHSLLPVRKDIDTYEEYRRWRCRVDMNP